MVSPLSWVEALSIKLSMNKCVRKPLGPQRHGRPTKASLELRSGNDFNQVAIPESSFECSKRWTKQMFHTGLLERFLGALLRPHYTPEVPPKHLDNTSRECFSSL